MGLANDMLRGLLDAAPDARLAVDADGLIVYANEQVENVFGWTSDELVGRTVGMLLPDGLIDEDSAPRDGLGRRKDGTEVPVEVRSSRVETGASPLALTAVVVEDLTERRAQEQERRERSLAAQREQSYRLESLGQLAGGVAHDFNNLLGVILNYATLIARSVDDPVVASDLVEIRTAAERGAALAKQMLAFARREVGGLEPVELGKVIEDAASMLERAVGEQVALELVMDDPPLVVRADRHQLEQVLLNVAINARDAMPAGGRLRITAERLVADDPSRSDQVLLRATDTGMGMAADVLARAFEPFFTTKDRAVGSGLGLATVHGIVRHAGGSVSLESEVGTGTTVSIRLPISSDEVHPSGVGRVFSGGGKDRILFVEAEESLRVGTARLLADHGYDVVVVADGPAALRHLEQARGAVDVVLSHTAVPRMHGGDFAARVEALCPGMPVVCLSGHELREVLDD